MFKYLDTNVVLQIVIFLIHCTKGPQVLTGKPATAISEIVYITVILSHVSANNYSLNRLNLWLLFFR